MPQGSTETSALATFVERFTKLQFTFATGSTEASAHSRSLPPPTPLLCGGQFGSKVTQMLVKRTLPAPKRLVRAGGIPSAHRSGGVLHLTARPPDQALREGRTRTRQPSPLAVARRFLPTQHLILLPNSCGGVSRKRVGL